MDFQEEIPLMAGLGERKTVQGVGQGILGDTLFFGKQHSLALMKGSYLQLTYFLLSVRRISQEIQVLTLFK